MKNLTNNILQPLQWPLPVGVEAAVTSRFPGFSQNEFAGLNLGNHVDDDPEAVAQNRQLLSSALGETVLPVYINQVHGNEVLVLSADDEQRMRVQADGAIRPSDADALYTRCQKVALVIQVADCLPILLCDKQGRELAAIHAGWRGLASGVIRQAIKKFESSDIQAWMGPAIGPCHYEVDAAVRDQFSSDSAFKVCDDGTHWMMSLEVIAKEQLIECGLKEEDVVAASTCTYCHKDYFSYRRDGRTGRFAALIWIDAR